MGLNKQKGNMYPWVTHTWNVVKGKCPHNCVYCYMKRFPQGVLHLDTRELRTDLGSGNTIFVGSSCDMFAELVPYLWIQTVLNKCFEYPGNTYLFQTKNPARFYEFTFPKDTILGTTIESNRCCCDWTPNAPCTSKRYLDFYRLNHPRKMVSIEPVMDFDLDEFTRWLLYIRPEFVSIGSDSKGHNLPEPDRIKVNSLIDWLSNYTDVKIKANLTRIMGET